MPEDPQLFALVDQVIRARLIAELNLTAETETQATVADDDEE